MRARSECMVAVDCNYYILLYLLTFIIFIFIYYLLYLISLEAKNRKCNKDFIAKEYNSANSKGNTIPEGGNHQSKQVPQSHLVSLVSC